MSTSPSSSPSGYPMLGRYQLVREIARSNDIVWEGHDAKMNRRVAVKELALAPNLAGQARRDRIERFYREARAAGAMNHPHIVTIYEVGEDRGRYFIAMEYLQGQTLRERLAVAGPIPLNEMTEFASSLCSALQYAHDRDVIHRDIKPDNIYLLSRGGLKLTDFGIARITTEDQLTVAGQIFGTPSYMSPEQVLGHPIDARSDQFSLAIVIYEMISGLKPFSGDSVPTITYRIIHEQAPHVLGAPPAVNAVLQRAMSKEPAGRYNSVAEFGAALTAALAMGTGQFPAYRPGGTQPPATNAYPQPTAQYGTQTQYGIAPGLAQNPSAGPSDGYAAAGYPPQPSVYPNAPGAPAAPYPVDPHAGGQKNTLSILVAFTIILVILVGGSLALIKALHNYGGESNSAHMAEVFGKAANLYQFGDYQDAAVAFNEVRQTPGITDDMRSKAIQYEVYSYRQLGHKAQTDGDLGKAAQWYQSALAVSPGDTQAQAELAAIQQQQTAAGTTPAAAVPFGGAPPTPDAGTSPTTPATPSTITTNDFEAARQAGDAKARPFLVAGKDADSKGNFLESQQDYRKAIEAGPGSDAATEAATALDESLKEHPDNSLISN